MTDSNLNISGKITVTVDTSLCQQSGMCTNLLPTLFSLDENDELKLCVNEISKEMLSKLSDAAGCCPTGAISVKMSPIDTDT